MFFLNKTNTARVLSVPGLAGSDAGSDAGSGSIPSHWLRGHQSLRSAQVMILLTMITTIIHLLVMITIVMTLIIMILLIVIIIIIIYRSAQVRAHDDRA